VDEILHLQRRSSLGRRVVRRLLRAHVEYRPAATRLGQIGLGTEPNRRGKRWMGTYV
jgi:hypothetical protein